jgi:hypothetical protein
MLFIFGTLTRQKEIPEYDFMPENCPHCGRLLKIMELTNWFTLFFLPIVKTEILGYYYFCPNCNLEFSTKDFKYSKYN